jgi:hypothetical protein
MNQYRNGQQKLAELSQKKKFNSQKRHEKMLAIFIHKGNANQSHTKIALHPC